MTSKALKLEKTVALVLTLHSWGNRAKAMMSGVQTEADKELFSLTKKLVDSTEYKDVIRAQVEVKKIVQRYAMPAFFREGVWLVDISLVDLVESAIVEQQKKIDECIEAFVSVYPKRIEEIRSRLKDQFNSLNYPGVRYLRNSFRVEYQWVEFQIPKGLPDTVFEAEKQKVEVMWKDAAEQITQSLRESFKELIAYASDMLAVGADGKTRKFKDATFENVTKFIEAFKYRNLTNDQELKALVDKAQKVMTDVTDPQELKSDAKMRAFVQKSFTEINKKLDGMIVECPTRKFNFDE